MQADWAAMGWASGKRQDRGDEFTACMFCISRPSLTVCLGDVKESARKFIC